MSHRILEQGISAVRGGSRAEGARLLRIALKRPSLAPQLRAIAYLWLAETQHDPVAKRESYERALSADPANAEARARLAQFLLEHLPASAPAVPAAPAATPAAASAPAAINLADYVVRVIGGVNGAGTAFFAADASIVVTTRHVVGALERLTIELADGRQVSGQVVRGIPALDLALIALDFQPRGVLPITPLPGVADETPLTFITVQGDVLRTRQRPTRRAMASHWIATEATRLPDAGGSPLFDSANYLVGMMTGNTSRTSNHLFAVHISAIRRAIDTYLTTERGDRRTYCPDCGSTSRAIGAGFFYCDVCGAVAPTQRSTQRYPLTGAERFYPPSGSPCVSCGAQVGVHGGRCLRCGNPARA